MIFSAPLLMAALSSLIPSSESFAPRSTLFGAVRSTSPSSSSSGKSFERVSPLFVSLFSNTTYAPQETTVASAPRVAQRWRKSTKQLATLGPASSSREMIEKLFLAGADCFRLNFSHGSQEQKKELLMTIREVEEKYSHPIGILGDLQGPKLRVSLPFDFLSCIRLLKGPLRQAET